MNDAETFVATSRVKGVEGTYELEFSLADKTFRVDYTIYDAEPLGLKPDLQGTEISFHKNLQWRFDKEEPNLVVATRSKEYANRFDLATLDDAFARMGVTNTRTTWGALTSAKSIVIQGLRDPNEYLEFPLDESFEPFRTVMRTAIELSSAGTASGAVASIKDNVFLLNGRPTDPEVEGELELTIDKQMKFKNGDLFLLKSKGGTQCPTTYRFVFADSSKTTVTPEFGTCAIASNVYERDGAISVIMPDDAHTLYRFDGVTLLENGKPVRQ